MYSICGTKTPRLTFFLLLGLSSAAGRAGDGPQAHVWEKREVAFESRYTYANPYTDVIAWVDLNGPGFRKRVFGFWDGGGTFRVRFLATAPGTWTWVGGSSPPDPGISGVSGSFEAVPWAEAELAQNPLRRGMIRPTANGHALEHADGTPFLAIGDTWYATPSKIGRAHV